MYLFCSRILRTFISSNSCVCISKYLQRIMIIRNHFHVVVSFICFYNGFSHFYASSSNCTRYIKVNVLKRIKAPGGHDFKIPLGSHKPFEPPTNLTNVNLRRSFICILRFNYVLLSTLSSALLLVKVYLYHSALTRLLGVVLFCSVRAITRTRWRWRN